MRRTEMSEQQLKNRQLFVDSLLAVGWRGSNFNQDFDQGLRVSPEASMEYSNSAMDLRFDFVCQDPRLILYLDSHEGKSLGFVFKCENQLEPLLDAVIGMQDTISPGNLREKSAELLRACPEMFKISPSGDGLIRVTSKEKGKSNQ